MQVSTADNLEILKGISLFADLDEKDRATLSDQFTARVFREGETVFAEESPGRSMMVIVSGEVRISSTDSGQGEETLGVLKRGDFFGEMALLDEMPRSATAIAHSDLILLEIERPSFTRFINEHPGAGVIILWTMARSLSARLRETNLKVKTFVNLSQWL